MVKKKIESSSLLFATASRIAAKNKKKHEENAKKFVDNSAKKNKNKMDKS
tara:strand:- start:130 stop:279 length:150 start_codon:yes stop_codon:yes gene_type:complete